MPTLIVTYNNKEICSIETCLLEEDIQQYINKLICMEKPYTILKQLPIRLFNFLLTSQSITKKQIIELLMPMHISDAQYLFSQLERYNILQRYYSYWKVSPEILDIFKKSNIIISEENKQKNDELIQMAIEKEHFKKIDFSTYTNEELFVYLDENTVRFISGVDMFQIKELERITNKDMNSETLHNLLGELFTRKYLKRDKTFIIVLQSFKEFAISYFNKYVYNGKPKTADQVLKDELAKDELIEQEKKIKKSNHLKNINKKESLTKTEKRIAYLENMKVNNPFEFGTAELNELMTLKGEVA